MKKNRRIWAGIFIVVVVLLLVGAASWMSYGAGFAMGAHQVAAIVADKGTGADPGSLGDMRLNSRPGGFVSIGYPGSFLPFVVGGAMFKLIFLVAVVLVAIGLIKRLCWGHYYYAYYGPPPGMPPHWQGPHSERGHFHGRYVQREERKPREEKEEGPEGEE